MSLDHLVEDARQVGPDRRKLAVVALDLFLAEMVQVAGEIGLGIVAVLREGGVAEQPFAEAAGMAGEAFRDPGIEVRTD